MKDRSSLYSDIKRTAETVLGVRTQCVLSRNLRKPKGLEQFCVNLGLKINAKLGGKNCSLSAGQIDFITSVPVSKAEIVMIVFIYLFIYFFLLLILFILFLIIYLDYGFRCRRFPPGCQ